MKKRSRIWVVWLVMLSLIPLALAGCGTTLNQDFGAGYGAIKLTRNLTADALDQNRISYQKGREIADTATKAESALDAAWTIRKTSADSTKTVLSQVSGAMNAVLDMLEQSLQEKK
jgi:hypothetical protein